jgi:Membrane transport protein MerF
VVALCGLTPGLAIVLGIVGLTAVTPSLDDVLCLGLAVLLAITVVSIRDGGRRRKAVFERGSAASQGATDLAPRKAASYHRLPLSYVEMRRHA